MSVTSKQNRLSFQLTADAVNYVLGSYDTAVTDGLPLNRCEHWRLTIDNTASTVDLTFTAEIMAKFNGTWAYVDSFVVPAGAVRSFQRDFMGWALRVSTNPGDDPQTIVVEFQAWSS